MEPHEPHELCSLPTLMMLIGDYAKRIHVTNQLYHEGGEWKEAFTFQLPRELVLAEVRRMADWCLAHRLECDEAVEEAKTDGDWEG